MRMISVLMALALVGCGHPPMRASDVVGVWKASDGAEFDFKADGLFSGHHVPRFLFSFEESLSFEESHAVVDCTGKWTIETTKQGPRLVVGFQSPGARPFDREFYESWSGGALQLYMWEGGYDRQRKYVLTRK